MALIKKLQTGQTINYDPFFKEYNLRPEDEKRVRHQLSSLEDNIKNKGWKISFNDTAKTYSITDSDNNPVPGFEGAKDYITSNFWGTRVKVRDDKDINSLAAIIYQKGLTPPNTPTQELSPTAQQTPNPQFKTQVKLPSWDEYTNREDVKINYAQALSGAKDQESRTKLAQSTINQLLQEYIDNAGKNLDNYDYINLPEAKNALELFQQSKYDDYNTALGKLGINPRIIDWSAEDQAALDTKQAEEINTQGLRGLKQKQDILRQHKLDPNFVYWNPNTQQYEGLTDLITDWTPSSLNNAPWFKDLLAQHKVKIFKNHLGQHHLFTPDGKLFSYDITDINHPGYGWGIRSVEGGTRILNPKQLSSEFMKNYKSPYTDPNTFPLLNTKILSPGFEGYRVYGDPSNQFGTIYLSKPGGDSIKLTRDDKGNYYTASKKQVQINPIIGAFNKASKFTAPDNYFPHISSGSTPLGRRDNIVDLVTELQKQISMKSGNNTMVNTDRSVYNDVVGKIYWAYVNKNRLDPKTKAYIEQNKGLIEKSLKTYNDLLERVISSKKSGGNITFAQKGMSFKEYRNKIQKQQAPVSGKVKDIANTWAGQDTLNKSLDIAAGIGTVGSFIPGWGAIGGLVMTGAEAVKGARDGWDSSDWGNLGMNLGFTALSLVGLGGLKSLQVAGKAAKIADKGLDVTKAVSKIGKVTSSSGKIASDVVKSAGITKADDAIKVLETLAKGGDEANTIAKNILTKAGLDVTKNAPEIAKKLLESQLKVLSGGYKFTPRALNTMSNLGQKTAQGLNKAANTTVGKVVAGGFGAAQIGSGVLSGYKIAKDAVDYGGLQYTNPEDAKQVLRGLGLAKGLMGNVKARNAFNRQTEKVTTPGKTTFKVGGKEVEVEGVYSKPAEVKSGFKDFLGKSEKIKETNIKNEQNFKDKLASAYKAKTGKTIKSEDIDLNSIKVTEASVGGAKLRENVNFTDEYKGNLAKAKKDWEMAREMLATGKMKPYSGWPTRKTKNTSPNNTSSEQVSETPAKRTSRTQKKSLPKRPDHYNKMSAREKIRKYENLIKNWKYGTDKSRAIITGKRDALKTQFKLKLGGSIIKAQNGTTLENLKQNIFKSIPPFLNKTMEGINKNYDFVDRTNLAGFIANELANQASQKHQLKSLGDAYYSTPLMERTHIPIGQSNKLEGERLANEYMSKAGKIANTSADFNRGALVKLSGADSANEVLNKANQADADMKNKLNLMQTQVDAERNKYNLQAITRNRAAIADISSRMHQVAANKALITGQNWMNLGKGLAANYQSKMGRKSWEKIYDFTQTPAYKQAQKEYNDAFSNEVIENARREFLDDQSKNPSLQGISFESSPQYQKLQSRRSTAEKIVKDYMQQLNDLKIKSTIGSWAKGGSLSDKIELENVKSRNKRSLKEMELLYKSIIEGNKNLKDVLIKVFD